MNHNNLIIVLLLFGTFINFRGAKASPDDLESLSFKVKQVAGVISTKDLKITSIEAELECQVVKALGEQISRYTEEIPVSKFNLSEVIGSWARRLIHIEVAELNILKFIYDPIKTCSYDLKLKLLSLNKKNDPDKTYYHVITLAGSKMGMPEEEILSLLNNETLHYLITDKLNNTHLQLIDGIIVESEIKF